MKRSLIIITAVATSILATSLTPAFAAKKIEKTKVFSFSETLKERRKKTSSTKNKKFILHRQGGTDTNADLNKGRGVGFNGGFYGHSGGL